MKKLYYALFLCTFLRYTSQNASAETPIKNIQEVNRLNWIEVYKGKLSTQIMLDFSQPIYFKKKILKDTFQVKLTFPGMHEQQFCAKQVIAKLSQLKQDGLLNNVFVQEKNKNISKVALILEFARTRYGKDKNDPSKTVKIPNRLLLKWCKMDDPNRLVIDIFSQEAIETLQNKNQTILFVKNDFYASDSTNPDQPKSKKKDLRIIIDPGHGGEDEGAKNFNLKEKDLALTIAKKTKSILQDDGFNVLLTRSEDKNLTLVERSKLAEQLNANLFVSIHINSDGGKGGSASGIETFYLNTKEFVSPTRHGGFLFMNLKKDLSILNSIDEYLKENTRTSQQLATLIQKTLVTHLHEQNFNIKDRGIKADKFRVLLRSSIPAALVEVGFLTNRKEALQLTNDTYQKNIALGIVKGINSFVAQHN